MSNHGGMPQPSFASEYSKNSFCQLAIRVRCADCEMRERDSSRRVCFYNENAKGVPLSLSSDSMQKVQIKLYYTRTS